MSIRAIAIHLPQFYPFRENDEWWGKGFTEWTNVTKAKPLFKAHYQPRLPSDLGFYDLRLEESRTAQAELAKEYGIHGFCFYHYWFNGKRLLNRPIDDMLKTKTPDFPFMICWANESWSKRWDGRENDILMKQEYSEEDDINHIRFLCEHIFSDTRYIRKDKKPFFLFYRPGLFPGIGKTIDIWRTEAVRLGIGELCLGYMQVFSLKKNPKEIGFDCAIEFHPDFDNMAFVENGYYLQNFLKENKIAKKLFKKNTIVSYKDYVLHMINQPKASSNVFPGITPQWDNSARKNTNAAIFVDSCPEEYEKWLCSIKQKYEGENTFLFINAWNEWAEGNYLEPCQRWGRKYLEATGRVLIS